MASTSFSLSAVASAHLQIPLRSCCPAISLSNNSNMHMCAQSSETSTHLDASELFLRRIQPSSALRTAPHPQTTNRARHLCRRQSRRSLLSSEKCGVTRQSGSESSESRQSIPLRSEMDSERSMAAFEALESSTPSRAMPRSTCTRLKFLIKKPRHMEARRQRRSLSAWAGPSTRSERNLSVMARLRRLGMRPEAPGLPGEAAAGDAASRCT